MKAVHKFLIGAAGLTVAAGGFAAPAAAQYYPGGGYGSGNVLVGAILDSILRGNVGGVPGGYGYGNQGYGNERFAVDQCARAAESRLNGRYGGGGYGGYNAPYGYGYNNAGPIRVNQIERVERTRNGNFRVVGWAGDAGWRGNYGYGGYNAPYGGPYGNAAAPSYRFSCKFDRSRGRITDLDLDRQRYARYGY